ncbi:hypothetical protein Tco_1132862 [Tanacetum coccineum]|uniref:Uncharacterized protein n=1 Tax=Tanacetum coccineum TaxID=301880 RepID=A0ABQ5JD48_9ASTR
MDVSCATRRFMEWDDKIGGEGDGVLIGIMWILVRGEVVLVIDSWRRRKSLVDGVLKGALGALGDEVDYSLSLEEKVIILLRSGNVISLVIKWTKGVKIGGRRWGTSTRSIIILTIISMSEWTLDSINDIVNAIVKMRIMFHDVSIEMNQEHAIRKIGG